ncbi:GumC domain-containing protein [Thiolapillus brandeum]|uniref:Polysaccharide chain length determinant N-terminal domain-containing protein n=1 Tax=Thiolapillus brandeum TaxID=1076588 RepID=A0A7U6GIK5_9GAMM|nr:hypothetical protein [Thiolapillus brandeum]BAO44267.1 hypothetical protein TBH_C1343 [Thiolapillus brandeum]
MTDIHQQHKSSVGEIKLSSILMTISKHRRSFLLVLGASVLLGIIFAMSAPVRHNYVTTIQIGSAYGNNRLSGTMIENLESVLTKLKQALIPRVTEEWSARNPPVQAPVVTVKAAKTTGIILLQTATTNAEKNKVTAFHRAVADLLVEEHHLLIKTQQAVKLSSAQAKLDSATSNIDRLHTSLRSLEQRLPLEKQQLERLSKEITEVRNVQKQFFSGNPPENLPTAGIYLLLSKLPSMSERRDRLEKDISFGLEDKIAKIRTELKKSEIDKERLESEQALLKNELDSLRSTRILGLALPMPGTLGLPPMAILFLSFIFGLIAAWLVVMILEVQAARHSGLMKT